MVKEITDKLGKSRWEITLNIIDKEIDTLVFELYGLKEEESEIVEGGIS